MFNKTALELAREISVASADGTLTAPLGYATAEMLRSQAEVISEMKAQRFAYASEFTLDEEGQPYVGSIHQNIRALKAENKKLTDTLELSLAALINSQFDDTVRNYGMQSDAIRLINSLKENT